MTASTGGTIPEAAGFDPAPERSAPATFLPRNSSQIEHPNVGFMLADFKIRLEACRYLTWKACHDFERTHGLAQELAIMTKVYWSGSPALPATWPRWNG